MQWLVTLGPRALAGEPLALVVLVIVVVDVLLLAWAWAKETSNAQLQGRQW